MSASYTLADAPGRVPLLGHIHRLLGDPLALFRSIRAYGDIVVIRLGSTPVHVVNHPDLIRQILVTDARKFDKGVQFEKARPFVGNGIATSSEPLHLRQRRLIQPAFHHARIARYLESMQRVAEATISAWAPGEPVALDTESFRFALRVLTDSLFSAEADASIIAEVGASLPVLLDGIAWRIAVSVELLEKLPTPSNRRFNAGRERLRATIDRLIADHRGAPGDRQDLLSMLLDARDEDTGSPMSPEQIRDEVMAMMLAGSETTASTIGWVCQLLGEHPQVQDRLRAEVDSVLGGRPVGAGDIARLIYMRQVINEVLRLYPPVWLVSRRALEDVVLGGHTIAAGASVFFSTYGVNRDPALHRDPDQFRPERWAEEPARSSPRGGFLPFGAGPRSCVGEPFAWAEMMVFLATLIGSRTLRPAPGRRVRTIARGSLRGEGLCTITEPRSLA